MPLARHAPPPSRPLRPVRLRPGDIARPAAALWLVASAAYLSAHVAAWVLA